jgi:hypothetical protein
MANRRAFEVIVVVVGLVAMFGLFLTIFVSFLLGVG